eukprot:173360_1
MSKDVATYCIQTISKDPSINTMTKSDKFIELMLNQLETQYDHGVICDLFMKKEAFKKLYADELKPFENAINKQQNVTINELHSIATKISIFDRDTAETLAKYLFLRKGHQISSWSCKKCYFVNCQLMVDALWRFYNQRNKCGLCGTYNRQENVEATIQNIHKKQMQAIMEKK